MRWSECHERDSGARLLRLTVVIALVSALTVAGCLSELRGGHRATRPELDDLVNGPLVGEEIQLPAGTIEEK